MYRIYRCAFYFIDNSLCWLVEEFGSASKSFPLSNGFDSIL